MKKFLKIAGIVIGCFFALSIIIAIVSGGSENTATNTLNSTKTAESSMPVKSKKASKYIKGLTPVDVYINMEKQGFKTEKNLSGEFGNSWVNRMQIPGINFTVETFSSNTNKVENVRATAMVDLTEKNIVAAQQFFLFVSSLPYENSNPQQAGQWVINNYNNDKASTIIGDAKLTIYAPSVALRMLTIEKAE